MIDFPQKDSPVDDFTLYLVGVASGAVVTTALLWWAIQRWEAR